MLKDLFCVPCNSMLSYSLQELRKGHSVKVNHSLIGYVHTARGAFTYSGSKCVEITDSM